jgi:hypothetical protein
LSRRQKGASQRPLRAPLVSFAGGKVVERLAPAKSKPHSAHGWAQEPIELDSMRHVRQCTRVLDAVRRDAQNICAVLDGFGLGPATRVVIVVERPLVRAVIDALEHPIEIETRVVFDDDGEDIWTESKHVQLFTMVSTLARSDGHMLAVAPIATLPHLLPALAKAVTSQLASGGVNGDGLAEIAERIAAPRVLATRFGLSVESLDAVEGRSL